MTDKLDKALRRLDVNRDGEEVVRLREENARLKEENKTLFDKANHFTEGSLRGQLAAANGMIDIFREVNATLDKKNLELMEENARLKECVRQLAKTDLGDVDYDVWAGYRAASDEALKWKSEYENVCKFATDYEGQRDQLREENARLKECVDIWQARATINGKAGFEAMEERDQLRTLLASAREALATLGADLGVFGRSKQLICDDDKHFQYLNRMWKQATAARTAIDASGLLKGET